MINKYCAFHFKTAVYDRIAVIRAGDILGALTGAGSEVGKIDIFDAHAYVAIARDSVDKALTCLKNGKIKGRSVMVRKSL